MKHQTGNSRLGRRRFNRSVLAASGLALAGLRAPRTAAQAKKLKVGVLLPRSGIQAQTGQSCQLGADVAPEVLRELLGVEIELMNADTESNADTARSRAERLIEQGANVLVGAFDSGHTMAVAQVAEQRKIPHIVNVAAAPLITEQGYRFVFRIFPTAQELTRNGLILTDALFKATQTAPKTAVFLHVNDTFGQSMAKGVAALLPTLNLPFHLVDTIAYDAAAKDLSVEIAKAKAKQADFLLLVCRLNDAIVLRREMVKQRWQPMGVVSPGSPGLYEEQFAKSLGKHADFVLCNTVWFNPKSETTKRVAAAFKKRNAGLDLAFHGLNMGFTFDAIQVAADAYKRAGSTASEALTEAIRKTEIPAAQRMSLGGPVRFNPKGQVEGSLSAVIQMLKGKPVVTLPSEYAEAKPVFPAPDYKKA